MGTSAYPPAPLTFTYFAYLGREGPALGHTIICVYFLSMPSHALAILVVIILPDNDLTYSEYRYSIYRSNNPFIVFSY